MRWHDLRHTCLSALVNGRWRRRWSLEEAAAFAGHSDLSVTRRYVHFGDEAIAKAAREMGACDVAVNDPGDSRQTRRCEDCGDIFVSESADDLKCGPCFREKFVREAPPELKAAAKVFGPRTLAELRANAARAAKRASWPGEDHSLCDPETCRAVTTGAPREGGEDSSRLGDLNPRPTVYETVGVNPAGAAPTVLASAAPGEGSGETSDAPPPRALRPCAGCGGRVPSGGRTLDVVEAGNVRELPVCDACAARLDARGRAAATARFPCGHTTQAEDLEGARRLLLRGCSVCRVAKMAREVDELEEGERRRVRAAQHLVAIVDFCVELVSDGTLSKEAAFDKIARARREGS